MLSTRPLVVVRRRNVSCILPRRVDESLNVYRVDQSRNVTTFVAASSLGEAIDMVIVGVVAECSGIIGAHRLTDTETDHQWVLTARGYKRVSDLLEAARVPCILGRSCGINEDVEA